VLLGGGTDVLMFGCCRAGLWPPVPELNYRCVLLLFCWMEAWLMGVIGWDITSLGNRSAGMFLGACLVVEIHMLCHGAPCHRWFRRSSGEFSPRTCLPNPVFRLRTPSVLSLPNLLASSSSLHGLVY
jgi:hypothetical protein